MKASHKGHKEIVEKLLYANADVNLKNKVCTTGKHSIYMVFPYKICVYQ